MFPNFMHAHEGNKNSAHLFEHKKMASPVSTINDTKLAKKVQSIFFILRGIPRH